MDLSNKDDLGDCSAPGSDGVILVHLLIVVQDVLKLLSKFQLDPTAGTQVMNFSRKLCAGKKIWRLGASFERLGATWTEKRHLGQNFSRHGATRKEKNQNFRDFKSLESRALFYGLSSTYKKEIRGRRKRGERRPPSDNQEQMRETA